MSDYLVKALAFHKSVRIYCAITTNTLNTLGDRLNYYPSALDAVGRILTMGVMMGSMLKLQETLTIQVEGNGPIGKIMVDADAHGHVRGYCDNPHCHFEYANNRLNAKATIGDKGFISIIKDLKLKEPFIGSTPIISGEVAEDFAYYFSVSEQVPSAVSLGVLVNTDGIATQSGGFIIQLLPGTSDEVIALLEQKLALLPSMSELLESGLKPEDIIHNISQDSEILETIPVAFTCNCSKERFEKGILSLGSKEIQAILEEDHQANTTCHFCGNQYYFSEQELKDLFEEAKLKEGAQKTWQN